MQGASMTIVLYMKTTVPTLSGLSSFASMAISVMPSGRDKVDNFDPVEDLYHVVSGSTIGVVSSLNLNIQPMVSKKLESRKASRYNPYKLNTKRRFNCHSWGKFVGHWNSRSTHWRYIGYSNCSFLTLIDAMTIFFRIVKGLNHLWQRKIYWI